MKPLKLRSRVFRFTLILTLVHMAIVASLGLVLRLITGSYPYELLVGTCACILASGVFFFWLMNRMIVCRLEGIVFFLQQAGREERLDQRLDVGSIQDEITELAQTINRQLDKAKRQSQAAHDIQSPITSIIGSESLLRRMLGEHPRKSDCLKLLDCQRQSAQQIVDATKNFSRRPHRLPHRQQ